MDCLGKKRLWTPCKIQLIVRLLMKPMALISALLILLVPAGLYAQTPDDKPSVYRLDVHVVFVDAQVVNKKTRHVVGNLARDNFQIYEDKVPQEISTFSQDTLPLSVVLLFDLTDSVRPVLESLGEGALEALQHFKPEDEVAVMVYAASTQVLQESTTDRSLVVEAIKKASRMKSDQAAFFNEGVFQASSYLAAGKGPASRRVIIWLTDDVPNIPTRDLPMRYRRDMPDERLHSQQDAMKELYRTGTVVCSLVKRSELSDQGTATLMSKTAERMLYPPGDVYRYAKATGGQVLESNKKQLKAKLEQLVDDLRMRYSMGYHPSIQKPKGKFCTIKVKLSPELRKSEGGLIVEAREGYYR
jgi:VWFA-related protein